MKNTWLFPFIESLHLAGMAMLVGTIALPKSRRVLTAWTHSGLLLLFVTGILMFFADRQRYLTNSAFRVKMAIFPIALAGQFLLVRQGRWGKAACIVLWTLVAIAGRAIADFDS